MDSDFGKKVGKGHIDYTAIDEYTFNDQYHTFQRSGYALNLSTQQVLGDYDGYTKELTVNPNISKKDNNKKRKVKELIDLDFDEDDDEDLGPWASVKPEKKQDPIIAPGKILENPMSKSAYALSLSSAPIRAIAPQPESPADIPGLYIVEPEEEDEKWEKKAERKMNFFLPPRPPRGSIPMEAKTTFHGENEKDFQGRSWMSAPQGERPDGGDHECYIPKRCVKHLTGHNKGVQAIEAFPGTGHLLLSASMDGRCKIWDFRDNFELRRTYHGHSEGVRSIQMSNDGKEFLSAGFDRYVRLWDVETGKAVGTFSNRKMNYCVKFNPRDNNVFLAASSDNRIYQWDVRSGQIVQQYNYHLEACSYISFIDEGRKFVSTSDDKKLLVWEYDIPVPIKYIQGHEMHAIPTITQHPTQPFFAGQSMDNRIVVYHSGENVKLNSKKCFRGHNNSGYACQINFSPNGKYLMSGDGLGSLYFWDWKTSKIFRKFPAHEGGPCIGAVWHPLHPNRIATCGWDGLIKIWE